MSNQLSNESSPYLLQHANNPVNWIAWSNDVFELAKAQDKLVLISVGYSACHWCHVMEHECFEDMEVAALMNEHFINVKVDREERPDVDQIYMTAVQLITQKGGWPLNCFTLPDGRPIYGGTYFPKEQWIHVLKSLVYTYQNDRVKTLEYAQQLTAGIKGADLIEKAQGQTNFEQEKLHEMVVRWARSFDTFEGGTNRAPKFPLPNNWLFLMKYATYFDEQKVHKQVTLTLDKMAFGGIYDQIGGGFTRYAVDVLWKVPHFEKMLYDNAQLIELYAKAYAIYQKAHYQEIVFQSFEFLERELLDPCGAYYSALDADSEGEEGKFYCWKEEEIDALFGEEAALVKSYWNINQLGYWEEGKYIPLKKQDDLAFAKLKGYQLEEWQAKKQKFTDILLSERAKRIRPGLDNKILVSWNAMMAKGLFEAYRVFGEEAFLLRARQILVWIKNTQWQDEQLLRVRTNGVSRIFAFLEDYAHCIEAFSIGYQCTGELDFLYFAQTLTEKVAREFQHPSSLLCYFTGQDTQLISRNMELNDNVIPASNSVMAHAFLTMGHYFQNQEWLNSAKQMLSNLYDGMEAYGSGYSNWGLLLLRFLEPAQQWHVLNGASSFEVF
ncbi:MAG: thioredoxin domain-containing protein, partial [Flavobacteriales bacterium]